MSAGQRETLDITPGVPHVFQAYSPSSTKRPPPWTGPGSSCPRIRPAPNASPHSDRQNARDDGPKNESRPAPGIRRSRPPDKPIARTLALAGREPGRLRNPGLAEHGQRKEETSQDQERLSAGE